MQRETGTFTVKSGLAEMLKGGVIMDVTTAEQAKIAEDAGACAVMALERVPADIRRDGGVARMADATKVEEIQQAVSIPVMAKARHRALRRSASSNPWGSTTSTSPRSSRPPTRSTTSTSGRSPCRSSVEPATSARPSAASPKAPRRSARRARRDGQRRGGPSPAGDAAAIAEVTQLRPEQYVAKAKELGAPVDLVRMVAEQGKLPVVNFAAGGLATPADAALMMQLGVDGVFVGSGIYKSEDPAPAPGRSSRRRPTSTTRRSWRRSPTGSGSRCRDSRSARSRPGSKIAAGRERSLEGRRPRPAR